MLCYRPLAIHPYVCDPGKASAIPDDMFKSVKMQREHLLADFASIRM